MAAAVDKVKDIVARGRNAIARRVPPGLRWVAGLFLVGLGFLGFLPIIGFWMIPLGLAVAALDLALLRRVLRRRGK